MPGATSWAWHSFNIISADAPSVHRSPFLRVDAGCEGKIVKGIVIFFFREEKKRKKGGVTFYFLDFPFFC